jgi:PTS system nitrogen regulatory IIA component
MEIRDLITLESVIPDLKATSKKQALQELAKRAARIVGREERGVFDVLIEREKLGTTGIGNGIAIPHGKFPDIDRIHGMFARLDKPIDFDSIDEQPVDLIFLLLTPETAGANHLKALARISRLLRDQTMCKKLRGSDTAEALYALLTESTVSNAA